MGRPPKSKRQAEDQHHDVGNVCARAKFAELSAEKSTAPNPVGMYEAVQMCPAIYKSFMANTYNVRPGPFATDGPIFQDENEDLNSHSQQVTLETQWKPDWPDYSSISTPIFSQTIPGSTPGTLSTAASIPGNTQFEPPAMCTCLSQLYLCLSSLSTITSFPLSPHTLSTLYNAARVARSVIYCPTCPQAFSTGVQNLMMLGTLLTVTADAWLRLTIMDAEALGKETVCALYLASVPTDPEERRAHWNQWLRKVIKHGVIGSSVAPPVHAVQSQCLESPDLLTLIEELEERQWVRHAARPCSDNTQMGNGNGDSTPKNERDYLCLRIVGNAREVIARFGFDPKELQERRQHSKSRPDEEVFAPWK